MHVHSHPTNFNAVDLSSARAAEKAFSSQRAADVRDQLLRGSLNTEGEASLFENFMVGGEPEGNSRQQQSQADAKAKRQPQSADDEQASGPFSFWV